MLEVDNVTVAFGGNVAVKNLSFVVRPGEVCALIGPNGAGKTTILNAITGFIPIKTGSIKFSGNPVIGLAPQKIADYGISRTFQSNGLILEMSVIENVLIGLERHIRSPLLGVICGMKSALKAEADATRQAYAALEAFHIADLADKIAMDLPPGQRRLVEICRTVVSNARLVLLDEPAVGLFETERQTLAATIRQLASAGAAVVLIEHVLDVVRLAADRVIVLNYGEKLLECAPHELLSHQSVRDAYIGHG